MVEEFHFFRVNDVLYVGCVTGGSGGSEDLVDGPRSSLLLSNVFILCSRNVGANAEIRKVPLAPRGNTNVEEDNS